MYKHNKMVCTKMSNCRTIQYTNDSTKLNRKWRTQVSFTSKSASVLSNLFYK